MNASEELSFEHSFKTTRRVSNVAKSCSDPVDTKATKLADLGDGWTLTSQIKVNQESKKKFLGLFLSAPKKNWGSTVICEAELIHMDGARFGQWRLERVFNNTSSWGTDSVVSIETLLKNLKDDAFTLVLNVRQTAAVILRIDPSRPRLSLSASKVIQRSLTSPSGETDIKFLNYNSKPKKNLKSHIHESFSSGRILSNRTTYFSSHTAFSEGVDMPASERAKLDSMPEFDASYDYLSDGDLESVEEVEDSDEPMSDDHPPAHAPEPNSKEGPLTDPKKWKIIAIGDVAHKTWLATLGFLYTDAILFASLSSKKVESPVITGQADLAFPRASCKSVFRVADKLGIKNLEDDAFYCLKSQLDDETIFHEIFSSFTARYERVKTMEFDYLIANWARLQSSDLLNQMLNEVSMGKRPQAVWLLHRMVQKLHA